MENGWHNMKLKHTKFWQGNVKLELVVMINFETQVLEDAIQVRCENTKLFALLAYCVVGLCDRVNETSGCTNACNF